MSAFLGTAPASFLILFVICILSVRAGVNLYIVDKSNSGVLLMLLGTLLLMGTFLLGLMTNGLPMFLSEEGYTFEQIVQAVAKYSWMHIILQAAGIGLIGLGFANLRRYEE
ncbi:MAG TPA: hypothetical protein GXX38_04245 [Clostridia bacterium]|jgi:hypothetical protein|nr:hypothetical protein [Clostridia bacterium]